MFNRVKQIFIIVALMSFPMVTIYAASIVEAIGGLESGNNFKTNTGNGAWGAYQQRTPALKDIGYMNKDGSWNAQASGAASLADYINCAACQTKGEIAYLNKNWSYMNSNGSVKKYLGTTGSNGIAYNQSALLECSNQMGASGCKDYLTNGNI